MGDDVVAVVSPAPIGETALTGRFLNRGITKHSIERDGLAIPEIDHSAGGVVLPVVIGALDRQPVLERDVWTKNVENIGLPDR